MNLFGKIAGKFFARAVRSPRSIRLSAEWIFRLGGFRRERSRVETILVVRLDRLGDLVMTSGFLRALRQDFPKARISLAVRESLASFARNCPDVDEVIPLPAGDGVMPSSRDEWKRTLLGFLKVCRKMGLWKRRFDLAVVPRRDVDNNGAVVFAYLSGARERIGFGEHASPAKREINAGFDRLLTRVIPGDCEGHEIASLARLRGEFAGRGEFGLVPWVTCEARAGVDETLGKLGISARDNLVAVCMGAGAPSRRWPVNNYAALLGELAARPGVKVVTIGSESEAPLGLELKTLLGAAVVNLEGKLPLESVPALVERCLLYAGSDTGPMHLAAAAGIPVLEISCHALSSSPAGPNSPVRFGPWGVPSMVVQPAKPAAPCGDVCMASEPHCILGVAGRDVRDALEKLLQSTILGRETAPKWKAAVPDDSAVRRAIC